MKIILICGKGGCELRFEALRDNDDVMLSLAWSGPGLKWMEKSDTVVCS